MFMGEILQSYSIIIMRTIFFYFYAGGTIFTEKQPHNIILQ